MMISTKGRYALRVMIDLAQHGGDSYLALREIAERQDISVKYLEAIVSSLSRAGYVSGLRGKGGGYRLTRSPEEYTVGGILRLTEGSLAPVSCLEGGHTPCSRSAECATLPLWRELDKIIGSYLDGVTLADLIRQTSDTCCPHGATDAAQV